MLAFGGSGVECPDRAGHAPVGIESQGVDVRRLAMAAFVALLLSSCTSSAGGPVNPTPATVDVVNGYADGSLSGAEPTEVQRMLDLYLNETGSRTGSYEVRLVTSAGTGISGPPQASACPLSASGEVAAATVVAVIGPKDASCTRQQVPILNEAEPGPLTQVSSAVSDPGLTRPWREGDPESHYPTGRRNFARVVTTDQEQGAALAAYAVDSLEVNKCAVLNDGQPTSQRVVVSFVEAAVRNGIEVLSNDVWDPTAPNYVDLFTQIQAKNADCVVLSGSGLLNGGQLLRDKKAVLGGNREVELLGTSNFLGAAIARLPDAQGASVPAVGWSLPAIVAVSPSAERLVAAYRLRYGESPNSAAGVYAVAALQVVMEAIARSDGTREGVTGQILGGRGIVIPEETSVLGREIRIDPRTGDVNLFDLTVYRVVDGVPALGTPVDASN